MHLLVFCSSICTTSVRLTLSRSFGGSSLGGSLSGTLSRLGLFGLLSLLVLLLFGLILLAEKGTEQAGPLTRLRAALGGLVLDLLVLLVLLSRSSLVLLGLLLLVVLLGLFLSLFLVFGGLLGSRSGGGRVG